MNDVSEAIRLFENSPGWWDGAAWERVKAEIDRLCEQADALADALELTLRFVPPWAETVPEGLDATFYGTLTMKGDLKVKEQVDGARAALRAYREPGSPAIHTKYLDDQLVERCITCLERWPCKEATQ